MYILLLLIFPIITHADILHDQCAAIEPPTYDETDINVIYSVNKPPKEIKPNDIVIMSNRFESNVYHKLIDEIDMDALKLWHTDTHYIQDYESFWRSATFDNVVRYIVDTFNLDLTTCTVRCNFYNDTNQWKPYHHDNHPKFAVSASFGHTRRLSFRSVKSKETISFHLEDGSLLLFGRAINLNYEHGILREKDYKTDGRFSIVIWQNY